MRIYPHFNAEGPVNSYLVCDDDKNAIMIDPAEIDHELIDIIETEKLNLKACLITNPYSTHVLGLPILDKIYTFDIYSAKNIVAGFKSLKATKLTIGGLEIEPYYFNGDYENCIIYRIGNAIFTGDVLYAGKIGETTNKFERNLLIDNIKRIFKNLDDNCLIYPGSGSVTKLRTERISNYDLLKSEVVLY
ncbi:MAG: MBL fold metallo-hydrolase [Sphaerochaetaceae bacterium]|nr:MBL fold metallo-hydrolase [Sphaerochaetaceae bacterium]